MPSRREIAIDNLLTAAKSYAMEVADSPEMEQEMIEDAHADLRQLGVSDAEITDAGWWDE